jgi:hypothetical protein
MSDDESEGLALRPTKIDGAVLKDDYQVIWQDMPIGRIMLRSGQPQGQPPWWFGVNVHGMPQPPADRGVANSLPDAQRRFKEVWKRVHSELAYSDLQRARAFYALQPHGRK